jgi:hypothetical protein
MIGLNLEDDDDAWLDVLDFVRNDEDVVDVLSSFLFFFFSLASFKTVGQSQSPITHLLKISIPVFPNSF